ncbi:toxin [Rhizobium sp. TH135]|uniref:BrnT family toxin n=1 Tax=Rhizobium sp. TH135 TaxID=2067451 RepID=UPI000C7BFA48|nr:BrnT family toxin [Rhizobium sp. TH135]PLK72398.1 toxin [Rhizobium sp. TH135]
MEFEFDPAKSEANKAKHGIDFVAAQELWRPGLGLTVDARSQDEVRYGIIGLIDDKFWVGYFTLRYNKIRIISVRRARKAEIKYYEDHNSG